MVRRNEFLRWKKSLFSPLVDSEGTRPRTVAQRLLLEEMLCILQMFPISFDFQKALDTKSHRSSTPKQIEDLWRKKVNAGMKNLRNYDYGLGCECNEKKYECEFCSARLGMQDKDAFNHDALEKLAVSRWSDAGRNLPDQRRTRNKLLSGFYLIFIYEEGSGIWKSNSITLLYYESEAKGAGNKACIVSIEGSHIHSSISPQPTDFSWTTHLKKTSDDYAELYYMGPTCPIDSLEQTGEQTGIINWLW